MQELRRCRTRTIEQRRLEEAGLSVKTWTHALALPESDRFRAQILAWRTACVKPYVKGYVRFVTAGMAS